MSTQVRKWKRSLFVFARPCWLFLAFMISALSALPAGAQEQQNLPSENSAASVSVGTSAEKVQAPPMQRCLLGPLTAQTCMIESGISIDGKLSMTLRGLYLNQAPPPRLQLLAGATREPLGRPLTAQVVDEKTPIDVVAVIMTERSNQHQWPDASDALRIGLGQLVQALYTIPGSRFGLLGYAHDKGRFSPQILKDGHQLLGEAQKAAVLSGIAELKIVETAELKWVASNAVARATALLASSEDARSPRRRLLVVFSNGVDSDKEGSEQMLELAASQALSLNISVMYIPPPGHKRAIAPPWRKLVESSGGLVYPLSKSPEELQAYFTHISEGLTKSLRIETPLPSGVTAGTGAESELFLLDLADEKSDPVRQVIRFSRPHPQYGNPGGEGEPAAASQESMSPLVAALVLVGMLGAALLLLRWQVPRLGSEALAQPRVATAGSVCAWLHWVERGRDIPLTRLPHRIGNDLDCDTITLGVGGKKKRAVLLAGDNPSFYFLQSLDPDGVQDSEQREQRSIVLQDGVEFFINQQRFKLFVSPLAVLERGA